MTGSMPTEGTGLSRGRDPPASAGDAVRSRGATQAGTINLASGLFPLSYIVITPHLDLPLLLDLRLQPTRTAKARAMSLQGKPTATSCRGRDVGHRAMPGSSADRSNDTL